MTYRYLPTDLAKRLRAAGLTVVEVDGWQTRGRPTETGEFKPVGVLNHHTGALDREGDLADDLAYANWLFKTGRADLPAPLCGLSISVEGTVYLGAAGRANHAGVAKPSGSVAGGDGNALYVGIEWMLSGTQPIPVKMLQAGATTNAVLLRVLGSSVQAVSCHYQTSVTGKWDIGDPAGVWFGDRRVLNVPRFRSMVQVEKDRLAAPPAPTSVDLTLQHTSLQFSDAPAQQGADADKVFSRKRMLLSGTEAGPKTALPDALAAAADRHGYHLATGFTNWVAVRRDLVKRGTAPTSGRVKVFDSFEGAGRHPDGGIVWLTFEHPTLGRVTHGCSHYLTKGRRPGDPNYNINRRLARAIGEWAVDKGRGSGLVFYGGDQNVVDRTEDTFFGSPLTSFWDELDHWENTGHGNIDVVASYDGDGRVKAKSIDAKDDSEIPLFADHFLVDAVAQVRGLA